MATDYSKDSGLTRNTATFVALTAYYRGTADAYLAEAARR